MADLPEYISGIPAGMDKKRQRYLDAVDRKRQISPKELHPRCQQP